MRLPTEQETHRVDPGRALSTATPTTRTPEDRNHQGLPSNQRRHQQYHRDGSDRNQRRHLVASLDLAPRIVILQWRPGHFGVNATHLADEPGQRFPIPDRLARHHLDQPVVLGAEIARDQSRRQLLQRVGIGSRKKISPGV
ncbi:MAG: hypothetical protein CM1200mP2_39900 [Planctomycetaceae bacterium]|nr:MAG: hypothetical protein CM1200mP2_39900 [Planctomycetaceae bacterium]